MSASLTYKFEELPFCDMLLTGSADIDYERNGEWEIVSAAIEWATAKNGLRASPPILSDGHLAHLLTKHRAAWIQALVNDEDRPTLRWLRETAVYEHGRE